MGEKLDSEAVREVMSRYFDEMRAALERYGGTVEKYIGDAIMAVFGLPKLHEDDALRATRAAFEMKRKLEEVNERLEATWGVRLENRTGVNTGEVVAGDVSSGQRLVTGDTVNTAARLEQAAPALEILIGDPTYRLVKDAVTVEPIEPLELKGKEERVPAYKLLGVTLDDGVARRKHQAVQNGCRYAMQIVGRMIRLQPCRQGSGEADRVPKAGHDPTFPGNGYEILQPHDLRCGGHHFRCQSGRKASQVIDIGALRKKPIPEFSDG